MATSHHRTRGRRSAPRRPGVPRWALLLAGLVAVVVVGVAAVAWSRFAAPPTTGAVAAKSPARTASAPVVPTAAAAPTPAQPTTPSAVVSTTTATAPTPSAAVAKTTVPVLLYHHVSPTANNFIAMSPAAFDRQMAWLSDKGFHSISQEQMVAFLTQGTPLPDKPVMITLDDGRANQYQYAVPILKKYGFTATFFVARKWVVGGSSSFMDAKQVRRLADQGFDIGSHTLNHAPLEKRSAEDRTEWEKRIHDEVYGSKTWVESLTGKPCLAIAYPLGYYGNRTWVPEICRAAGYKLGYSVDGGSVRYGDRPFLLKRNDTGKGSFAAFRSYLPK